MIFSVTLLSVGTLKNQKCANLGFGRCFDVQNRLTKHICTPRKNLVANLTANLTANLPQAGILKFICKFCRATPQSYRPFTAGVYNFTIQKLISFITSFQNTGLCGGPLFSGF